MQGDTLHPLIVNPLAKYLWFDEYISSKKLCANPSFFLRLRQQWNGGWIGIASQSMREQDVPLKLAFLLICCFVLERRMRQKRDGCRRNAPDCKSLEHPMPRSGFRGRSCSNPRSASKFFVWHLYLNIPAPEVPVSQETPIKVARNDELRKRYEGGESISKLARAFGLSNARVHQILHNRRK